jgi:hypothetical protein
MFQFTFQNLKRYFEVAIASGYRIMTCEEYVSYKQRPIREEKVLINRVDIDISCRKARKIATLFQKMKIRGTFFVRLHAEEYNPFSFENYRCLKFIRDQGNEIGYHSEVEDEAAIWSEESADCLIRDIKILKQMLGIEIKGVASHGGMTGLNNLDFWRGRKPGDFGLLYEAYDQEIDFGLFHESLYVSDANWTHWKCYENGQLREDDRRTLGEHCKEGYPKIYSLIHPETYYEQHFYE